jgi:hypothetical protein
MDDALPIELIDIILKFSIQDDITTMFVLPFVCRLWKNLQGNKRFFRMMGRPPEDLVVDCAGNGYLNVAKWLMKNGRSWDTNAYKAAAENGHIGIIKWAWSKTCLPLGETVCAAAARGGHFDILKELREECCYWDEETCNEAARGGHLEILKWAKENFCPWSAKTFACAVASENLEMIRWLAENDCPRDETASAEAAKKKDFGLYTWVLINGGHTTGRDALVNFARVGDLIGLKWSYESVENGLGIGVSRAAAEGGHLNILEWIKEVWPWNTTFTPPWDETACSSAAAGGHLQVLEWLGKNQCPRDKWTCIRAAEHGHLQILKWAHSIGELLSVLDSSVAAAKHGHLGILDWLKENVVLYHFSNVHSNSCYKIAAKYGQLRVLEWLERTSPHPIPKKVSSLAATHGHFFVLKWAIKNGQLRDRNVIAKARIHMTGKRKLTHLLCKKQNESPAKEKVWTPRLVTDFPMAGNEDLQMSRTSREISTLPQHAQRRNYKLLVKDPPNGNKTSDYYIIKFMMDQEKKIQISMPEFRIQFDATKHFPSELQMELIKRRWSVKSRESLRKLLLETDKTCWHTVDQLDTTTGKFGFVV